MPGRGEQRHPEPGDEQPGSEQAPAAGSIDGGDPDADGADDERDERRAEAAEVEALQRVDVADHPAEQIAAAETLELRRRERLDPRVERARGSAPSDAQGEVVRGEPIEVARQRPREAEEAHGTIVDRRARGSAGCSAAREIR